MGTQVKLYVYDLSQGIALAMSAQLLGRRIEGIWHTSIVVYEREYYFGSGGIMSSQVGGTILGEPNEKIILGETFVPYSVFKEYLQGLGETTFNGEAYNLLKHNCNHFSDEVSQFLCGKRIPKHIVDLPDIILETSIGPLIVQLLNGLSTGPNIAPGPAFREESPEFRQLNSAIEEARTIPPREPTPPSIRMAESESATQNGEENGVDEFDSSAVTKKARDVVAEIEAEEKRELEEIRKKQREPPITFKDALDVRVEFDALVGLVDGKLNPEEQQSLEELHQYMLEDEGSWALGDGFLNFVGRLLHDKSLSPEVRVRALNVLACAALKDDVILLLHQDRREHVLMNYAGDVERLTPDEQQALSLFFANLFENLSSSEWLLYISEWQYNNSTLSNIRVTTKVAVNALLSDNPTLQDRGSAIIHNMACKEVKTVVFDDVAVELTMALLQFLNSNPPEEQLFRVLKSLARFCQISGQDVPQLIQMIGPEPGKFKGASPRIDEQIELITKKFR